MADDFGGEPNLRSGKNELDNQRIILSDVSAH
jgi:hypothetical protein